MSIVRAVALTAILIIAAALAQPALSKPNNGGYGASSAARLKADACDMYKDLLELAESEADKRAGTRAAKQYADEADMWYAAGVRHGCSWAA